MSQHYDFILYSTSHRDASDTVYCHRPMTHHTPNAVPRDGITASCWIVPNTIDPTVD
jgi:hypothetical protein